MRAIPMGLKVSSFLRTCSKSKVSKASGLIIPFFLKNAHSLGIQPNTVFGFLCHHSTMS